MQLPGEDDVFDEHGLDFDSPPGGNVFDDFANAGGYLFPSLNDILEDSGADDVSEGGLGTLDEGLLDVGDTEGGFVGGDDVVVYNGGELDSDIVLCHTDLLWDFGHLNFDINLDQFLRKWVDLD